MKLTTSNGAEEPLTKGRIAQLFDERQPFGERAASSLALRVGLPEDYFERDQPESGAEPPRLPPRDYQDRHEVSDTDWGLLQDIRMMISDAELAELRAKAARAKQVMAEQHPELVGGAVHRQQEAPSSPRPSGERPSARVYGRNEAATIPQSKKASK